MYGNRSASYSVLLTHSLMSDLRACVCVCVCVCVCMCVNMYVCLQSVFWSCVSLTSEGLPACARVCGVCVCEYVCLLSVSWSCVSLTSEGLPSIRKPRDRCAQHFTDQLTQTIRHKFAYRWNHRTHKKRTYKPTHAQEHTETAHAIHAR